MAVPILAWAQIERLELWGKFLEENSIWRDGTMPLNSRCESRPNRPVRLKQASLRVHYRDKLAILNSSRPSPRRWLRSKVMMLEVSVLVSAASKVPGQPQHHAYYHACLLQKRSRTGGASSST